MNSRQPIRNQDGALIAARCTLATTPWARLKGLLGRSTFEADEALWLTPCNSIHTWFMKFPIDVVFLDRNNRVVRLVEHLVPNRMGVFQINAASVVEFHDGTIQRRKIQPGDVLTGIPSAFAGNPGLAREWPTPPK